MSYFRKSNKRLRLKFSGKSDTQIGQKLNLATCHLYTLNKIKARLKVEQTGYNREIVEKKS